MTTYANTISDYIAQGAPVKCIEPFETVASPLHLQIPDEVVCPLELLRLIGERPSIEVCNTHC